MWLCFYWLSEIVFPPETHTGWPYFISNLAMAIFVYGTGLHVMNTAEICAREHAHIDETDDPKIRDLYNMIWNIDENLSHNIQFYPFSFFWVGLQCMINIELLVQNYLYWSECFMQ
eukprot:UN02953